MLLPDAERVEVLRAGTDSRLVPEGGSIIGEDRSMDMLRFRGNRARKNGLNGLFA